MITAAITGLLKSGIKDITGTIKHKNELKFKAQEASLGYLKLKMTTTIFSIVALTSVLPYLLYMTSPFLKYIPFMTEILSDYAEIIDYVGFDKIYNIILGLLGLGGIASVGTIAGKVKMASKKIDKDTEIKKELIRRNIVGDDFVSLILNEDSNPSLKVKRFFKKYSPMAIELEKKYAIPASAALAHLALESGWGRHELKAVDIETGIKIETNNVFNITKGSTWTGKTAIKEKAWEDYNGNGKPDAGEYQKVIFRVYRNKEDAFNDYGKLIVDSGHMEEADLADDPIEYAKALKNCGYMTDGLAPEKMIKIMKKYFIYET